MGFIFMMLLNCNPQFHSYTVAHMKQCAEDMELKLQGNKQSVVYSGIKNIVKTSSGEKTPAIRHKYSKTNADGGFNEHFAVGF